MCWFVASPLWNAAIPANQRGLILCPACFVAAFEDAGCGNVAWELSIDPGTAHHLRDDLRRISGDRGHTP